MLDKSLSIFLMMLLTIGGMVILVVTWVLPMPLSERIVPSFFGAAGIIGVLVWALVLRSKSAKVRVTSIPGPTLKRKPFNWLSRSMNKTCKEIPDDNRVY